MLRIAALVLVVTACGPATEGPVARPLPPKPVAHAGSAAAGSGAGSAAQPGPVAAPELGCPAPSCAYHAGAAGYFTCLSGGAGACFHFGGPCAPADGCMFDGHAYRPCTRAVEGTCAQWGAGACAPRSGCMFDPADGLHHHCDDVAGGTCNRYGALCAP
ncbi:MAG TPA: hypothetical protein VGF94_12795 [Kofleriaceae bacterium]